MPAKEIPFVVSKSPDYRTVYAEGAMGGANPYNFRLVFYNHSVRYPENPKEMIKIVDRVLHTEVILSFKALVELRNWLDFQVKKLEKDKVLVAEKKKKK